MTDNYQIRDANNNSLTFKAKDTTNNGGPLSPQSIPSDVSGNPYNDANPSSVAVQARQVVWTDRSSGNGTQPLLTTSSVAIISQNTTRRGLFFQNLDRSNFMYINIGSAASTGGGSLILAPLQIYEVPLYMMDTRAVYALGDAANQQYTAKEC